MTVVMAKMIWNWHLVRHEGFKASHSVLKRKNQRQKPKLFKYVQFYKSRN